MAKIHVFLQGKGGVGKSFCATMLAQYLLDHDRTVLCIDTDPVNMTFASYLRFQAIRLDLMTGKNIDPLKFDQIIEQISTTDAENIIIDNGSSSFVAFSNFLLENTIPAMLTEEGHQMLLHTIVTGGTGQYDTVHGFASLAQQFEGTLLYVWLNPYLGNIEHEGKLFTEFRPYLDNANRVAGIIEIPAFPPETFGVNFAEMLKSRKTFAEATAPEVQLPIMTRHRLKMIQKRIYDAIALCPEI